MNGYPIGGTLVRAWTIERPRAAMAAANTDIKTALRGGDTERALLLISRKIGLRVCAGEIKVSLKPHRQDQPGQQHRSPDAVCHAARGSEIEHRPRRSPLTRAATFSTGVSHGR